VSTGLTRVHEGGFVQTIGPGNPQPMVLTVLQQGNVGSAARYSLFDPK
jgi:hypothetical protein